MMNVMLTEGTGLIEGITQKATELIGFGGTLLDTVIAHPVLGLFFACGFVSVGITVIGKLTRFAKR